LHWVDDANGEGADRGREEVELRGRELGHRLSEPEAGNLDVGPERRDHVEAQLVAALDSDRLRPRRAGQHARDEV
jgi:hypothetical protein